MVMYHRFCREGENRPRHLRAGEFAWQLEYLKRHHQVWSPDEQLDAAGQPLPASNRPPVVITVDDGYSDFASVAFPLLQQFGFPATVFLTTGFVSGQTWFWWDKLKWLLENCPPGERLFQFAGQQVQGNPDHPDQHWELWHVIADHLSTIDNDLKKAALKDLFRQADLDIPVTAPEAFRALSWDQVREMASHGISFGAHTINHPVLSKVDSSRAEKEITGSMAHISTETGHTPGWFCYPQGGPGDFGPGTVVQVRHAGFRGCYTAFPDPRHDGDPLTLPRYSVSDDRLAFQWIICGAEHLFALWKLCFFNRKGLA